MIYVISCVCVSHQLRDCCLFLFAVCAHVHSSFSVSDFSDPHPLCLQAVVPGADGHEHRAQDDGDMKWACVERGHCNTPLPEQCIDTASSLHFVMGVLASRLCDSALPVQFVDAAFSVHSVME